MKRKLSLGTVGVLLAALVVLTCVAKTTSSQFTLIRAAAKPATMRPPRTIPPAKEYQYLKVGSIIMVQSEDENAFKNIYGSVWVRADGSRIPSESKYKRDYPNEICLPNLTSSDSNSCQQNNIPTLRNAYIKIN